LVGYGFQTTIENSYASGSVGFNTSNTPFYDGFGGLVGYMDRGAIKNSYANTDVDGGTTGDRVGGLAGGATNARIENSYATGNVRGDENVGGFLGTSQSTVLNNYATGHVEGANNVGGFAGLASGGPMTNNYATGEVTGTSVSSVIGGFIGRRGGGNWTATNNSWNATTAGEVAYKVYNSDTNSFDSVFSQVGTVTGRTTAQMKEISNFLGTGMDIAVDPSLTGVMPQLRSLTPGLGAGTSIWVMGAGETPVTTPTTKTEEPPLVIATLAALPALNLPRSSPPETPVTQSVPNVTSPPAYLTELLGGDGPLLVVTSPEGAEAAQWVNLSDADRMVSGASSGEREMRVPASRNSLAQILQGGVKLPAGVEQQLYVVKGN
jgi:hypothetical protein